MSWKTLSFKISKTSSDDRPNSEENSPGLSKGNGERDAEERVKRVALFQAVGARQRTSEGQEAHSDISREEAAALT